MKEESLFHEALAQSSFQERLAFLDRACAGDPILRAAVDQLLAAHEQSGDFLAPVLTVSSESDGNQDFSVDTANQAMSTDADSRPSAGGTVDAASPTVTVGQPGTDLSPPVPEKIGRYRIREQIGRGGMGTVYVAHDPELDRVIALKIPKLVGPEAEERFLREARAAAAVSHPNLCPVYDAGRADGIAYLAMAYVPGSTLSELLSKEGRLQPARATTIAAGVARGMAEAHRHGIIHRDLKPGNILFDRHGEPVVTDFGLARRDSVQELTNNPDTVTINDPRLTQAGALMGTPAYMSPEQARSEQDKIGPASDVYSLGAILFEMLTGRQPFRGDSVADTLRKIENDPVPAMPKVSAGLATICRRALAKEQSQRIPSMAAFAESLAAIARRRQTKKWTAVAVAACLLIAIAGVVFYIRTNNGTVEVRLNNSAADVQVSVDGQEVVVTDNGRVTRLKPGEHGLEVKGDGFETVSKQFKIMRGDKLVLEVELKPNLPKPPSPIDREKLARLLARGRSLIDQDKFREAATVAEEALTVDPESPLALAIRARCHAVRNNFEAARTDADTALKLNPETLLALIVRSFVELEQKRYDECIADAVVASRLDPKAPGPYQNLAQAYLRKSEYQQAVVDATNAIDRGYRLPDAYLTRGWARACLGQYDKAIADHDAAEKMAPTNPIVFAERSIIYAKMGDTKKAAIDREKALTINKDFPIDAGPVLPDKRQLPERNKLTPDDAAKRDRAILAVQTAWNLGKLDDAAKAVEEACKIDPTSAIAHAWRSRVRSRQGQPQAALDEANEAVRLDPELAAARLARGFARASMDDAAGAIADLTIALRIDAKAPLAWNNRGWSFMMRGQYHQAVADFTEAIALPGIGGDYSNRGEAYLHLGEYEKALADFVKSSELQPRNGRLLLICAAIRTKLNDLVGAERDRKRAIEIDAPPQDAPPVPLPPPLPPVKKDPELESSSPAGPERAKLAGLLQRCEQLLDMNEIARVEQIVEQALEIDPESPGALGIRATVRLAQNDFERARKDAEKAIKLNPEAFRGHLAMSVLNAEDKKFQECIASETIVIRLRPQKNWGWVNRAGSYLELKEYRQAIHDASRAIDQGFTLPKALLTRGAAYGHLGEYDNALADYNAAAKMAPEDWHAFNQRALVHARKGNKKAAEDDWKRAETLNPALKDVPRGALPDPPTKPERKKLTPEQVAERDRLLKQWQKAWDDKQLSECQKAADQAFAIDPTSARVRNVRGLLLGKAERFEEAIEELTEAIRLDPDSDRVYVARGLVRFDQGKPAEAIADFNIALRINDKDPQTWNNRGFAYMRRQQYHQALADLTRSLELRPDYALALSNRGVCYATLGEYEKAHADYVKVCEYQPRNPKWHLNLAVLKAKLGDQKGAEKEHQTAIEIDPSLKNAPLPDLDAPLPPIKKDPEPERDKVAESQARLAGLLERGRQLVRDTRFADLGAIADEALQLDPESPGALALRATYRAFRNDIEKALADADAALKLNPETHRALSVRSFLNSNADKNDEAIADLTIAIRLEPRDFVAWKNRGTTYFQKKEYAQTIADATQAIELGFPRENVYLDRGAAYACLGQYDKALADYDAAAKLAPQNASVFNQRSALHARMGSKDKAAADWMRAKELDKGLTDLGRALFPNPPKLPDRRQLTSAEKAEFESAFEKARLAYVQGRGPDCLRALDEACQIDPTHSAAHTMRARAFLQSRRLKETIVEATAALRLDPQSGEAYAARGIAHVGQEEYAAGIADLTIAIRLVPKNHPANQAALSNRAFAYNQRRQPHQALADAEVAVQLIPNDPNALANRGLAHLLLQQYEAALADYLVVADNQQTNAERRMMCAAICAKLGKVEEYRKQRELAAKYKSELKDAPDVELPTALPPAKKDPE